MLALLCLISTTLAGQVGLTGGMEWVGNDPFLRRSGHRIGAEYALNRHLRAGISGAFYPDLGQADWTPLTDRLVRDYHISPDLSPMTLAGRFELRVAPFVHRIGILEAHTGGYVGLGAVVTRDDLEALQAEGETRYEATQDQLHPSTTWGLFSEVGGDTVRGRLRLERTTYLETVASTIIEMKGTMLWSLEVTVWLGS